MKPRAAHVFEQAELDWYVDLTAPRGVTTLGWLKGAR